MRKLSMKKAGTPAIEEDSDSGSGGVSADGLGARLPRFGFACEPALAPSWPPGPCLAVPCFPARLDRVLPWALCPLTCGAAAVGCGVVAGADVDSVVVA